MITLSFQDNSIIFTFEDSSHYLQGNGVIEAPKGSLALICDESDMATFVKASSNDIFVSATYEELGMTKAQLLETFAENAGSSSGGGGGGGLTPQEAQEMIDSSISGKADTSAVTEALASKVDTSVFNSFTFDTYNTFQTKADVSALTQTNTNLNELGNLVNEKLATSTFTAYTSTTESAIASKASQADLDALEDVVDGKADTTAMTEALASKLNISDFNTYSGNVDSVLATKANLSDIPDVSSYINSTDYDSVNHLIKFFHNETLIDLIDAADFIKDGMVSNVEISGGNLVISFNTDAGKEAISIPLTDIFNPNNYYDKTATDVLLANKVDVSAYTAYTSATDGAIASKASNADLQSVSGVVDTKLAISDFNTYSASVDTTLQGKQATLTAGNNIDITNNVISVTGSTEITIDDELSTTSTNPVVNSAITKAIQDNELVAANAFAALQEDIDEKADASALTDYVQATAMTQALTSKVDVSAYTAYTSATDTAISSKASQTDLQSVSAATASNTTALGGYKLAKMTTAEYEALTVKDASTIYFIVD